MKDWDPGAYDAFRGLRLRPALDLLGTIGTLPPGDVIDLGCGSGAAGPALRAAYPEHRLKGLDASPAMRAKAEATKAYDAILNADITVWAPDAPVALIFSNAVLHWLPDHATLFPRLVEALAPGGWLAVQMPGQNAAPSHASYRTLTGLRDDGPGIASPEDYEIWLSPLGSVRVWETSYYQHLPATPQGHPVRAFTSATYGRPFLAAMTATERSAFEAEYDAEMAKAYPLREDGSVLFPFRRVFVLFQRVG